MMSGSGIDDLYGALASVAAITTALQAAVALQPLTHSFDIERRQTAATPGTQAFTDCVKEAQRARIVSIILNLPAAGVNGAVLAAWYDVAFGNSSTDAWVFRIPWLAVTVAAAWLLVSASYAILKLHGLAKD